MNYNKDKIKELICNEYARYTIEKYINKYSLNRFNAVKSIFAPVAADLIIQNYLDPKTFDEWEESKHPRKKNGQFGEGGESSKRKKTSERQNRVKKRPRNPVKLPKEDAGVIHHNIVDFGFKDFEKNSGIAKRFSANYGVTVKINNADIENLSYTIIKKWKLK